MKLYRVICVIIAWVALFDGSGVALDRQMEKQGEVVMSMRPGEMKRSVRATVGGEPVLVRLEGTSLGTMYELRLSYPAVMPAKFHIDVVKVGEEKLKRYRHGRRLLNADKAVFKGFHSALLARIRIDKEGISYDPEIESREVVFNLNFDTLYLGATAATWKMIAFLVPVLGVALRVGLPRLHETVWNTRREHDP